VAAGIVTSTRTAGQFAEPLPPSTSSRTSAAPSDLVAPNARSGCRWLPCRLPVLVAVLACAVMCDGVPALVLGF
jgi:hypothetical protein